MQKKSTLFSRFVTGLEMSAFFANFLVMATAFCMIVRAVGQLP